MVGNICIVENSVNAADPNATYQANEPRVRKIFPLRNPTGDYECIEYEDSDPKDRLDRRRNSTDRKQRHHSANDRKQKDEFPVHSRARIVEDTLIEDSNDTKIHNKLRSCTKYYWSINYEQTCLTKELLSSLIRLPHDRIDRANNSHDVRNHAAFNHWHQHDAKNYKLSRDTFG